MSDAKLFGTDGIRGIANQFPLTPEFVVHIGSAIGEVLKHDHERPVAIIGRDTRLSGTMIENALAAGLLSQGFDTLHVGVLTTPGIAFLTYTLGARCGVSISASHNPFDYNGIKVFGADGFKVPDESENQIESIAYARRDDEPHPVIGSMGQRRDDVDKVSTYVDFLLGVVKCQPILRGKCVVVDCNNGATFDLAPRVLHELGAQVIVLNTQPDGVNINHGYDSLEPKLLRDTVLRERADFGVQFHRDGDRAVFLAEGREGSREIHRHRRVRRVGAAVELGLDVKPGYAALTVFDDGRGFDLDEARRRGLGLLSMRERAAQLGGNLNVVTEPGLGTRVYAVIPLEQETPREETTP